MRTLRRMCWIRIFTSAVRLSFSFSFPSLTSEKHVLTSRCPLAGSKDRNRALEGDIVAVELLDVRPLLLPLPSSNRTDSSLPRSLSSQVDEVWGTKKDKEEKKRKKEEQASYDPRAARDIRKQDKKKDDVEVEGQGLLLFEEEEVNDEQKPQFAGHVVAVLERAPGQLFSGTLGVLRPSSAATQQKQDAERREREGVDLRGSSGGGGGGGGGQNGGHHQQAPKIIWFRPTDKRVPLIAIRTSPSPLSIPSSSSPPSRSDALPFRYSDRSSPRRLCRPFRRVPRPPLRRLHQALAHHVPPPLRSTRRGTRSDR